MIIRRCNEIMAEIRQFMAMAIEESKKSLPEDIPVGCVIVKDGQVISKGHNTRELTDCATGHAEINAIENACRALGDWRLDGCSLYVTLEPCPMCAGAIRGTRLDAVYFGAPDLNEGACGSVWNLLPESVKVYPFILKDECTAILQEFFQELRRSK